MLSRVAERVYWQARYLERAENTARMLNVFSTLLLDLPPRTKLGWHSLVEITGTYQAFDAKYKQASERNVMRFLLVDNNGHSVLDMLAQTRENARTTREIMPTEAFEQIKQFLSYLPNTTSDVAPRVETGDPPDRRPEELLNVIPSNRRRGYDLGSHTSDTSA